MGWIEEDKRVRKDYYSKYSQVCKELGIERVPFHSFKVEMYRPLKQQLNRIKYKGDKK